MVHLAKRADAKPLKIKEKQRRYRKYEIRNRNFIANFMYLSESS